MPGKLQKYENNPFHIALSGLNLVFEKARGVAFLLIAFSIFSVFSGSTPGPGEDGKMQMDLTKPLELPSWPIEQWVIVTTVSLLIILAFVFINAMISGMSAYTTAELARGRTVKLSEAFHAVLDRFFSYIWLQIIIHVKILLWSLLLIVPGIIMAYRYSLANVSFFDKKLKGNAAVKDSLQLTKGAWLTTFASQVLFNIITLGVISEFVNAGAKVILYRQFNALKKDEEKPAAHGLSWFTIFFPFMLAFLLISIALSVGFIALLIKALP